MAGRGDCCNKNTMSPLDRLLAAPVTFIVLSDGLVRHKLPSRFEYGRHFVLGSNLQRHWKVTAQEASRMLRIELLATSSRPNLDQVRKHFLKVECDSSVFPL